MQTIAISSLSLAPGFHSDRKQLLRLLNRAAILSEKLHLKIDEKPVAAQLTDISRRLQDVIANQAKG